MPRNHYAWRALIVSLRKQPNRWVLAKVDVPKSVVKIVRYRKHPDLRVPERLDYSFRSEYEAEDGSVRGDLYMRLVP